MVEVALSVEAGHGITGGCVSIAGHVRVCLVLLGPPLKAIDALLGTPLKLPSKVLQQHVWCNVGLDLLGAGYFFDLQESAEKYRDRITAARMLS